NMMKKIYFLGSFFLVAFSCEKKSISTPTPLELVQVVVDNKPQAPIYYDVKRQPVLKLSFNNRIDIQTVATNISLTENNAVVAVNYSYEKSDSTVVIVPQSSLKYLTRYHLRAATELQ